MMKGLISLIIISAIVWIFSVTFKFESFKQFITFLNPFKSDDDEENTV